MRRDTLSLPVVAPGTRRELEVMRFGTPGARPKAYLQAGLHADELPGMLVLKRLADMLEPAEAAGDVAGEVVVVPVANPIGLAQQVKGYLRGRYEENSAGNFNRGYADLAEAAAPALAGRLGADAAANVAAIRRAMAAALAAMRPQGEIAVLRHLLLGLAHDADLVLDLHADNQAVLHLYLGTPLWPGAADLAAELGARAVLLAEVSGGNPFDEACGGPWWALARRFPEAAIPPACLAATVELRSNNDVDARLAEDDARALLRFLTRRGVLRGPSAALPALACDATPLEAMQQVIAPAAGLVVYRARLGDRSRRARPSPTSSTRSARRSRSRRAPRACSSPATTSRSPGPARSSARSPAARRFPNAPASSCPTEPARVSRIRVVHTLCMGCASPESRKLLEIPRLSSPRLFQLREQDARLRVRHRLQRPDPGQRPVERGEIGGGDLRHQVPAPVGRMHPPDLRHPPQRRHHGAGVGRAHLDRHDRPHPGAVAVAASRTVKPRITPARQQPVDAVLHRAARHAELPRQRRARQPAVVAQQRDQPPVGVVEGGHLAIRHPRLAILPDYCTQSSALC